MKFRSPFAIPKVCKLVYSPFIKLTVFVLKSKSSFFKFPLTEKEKEYIRKALVKHKGRRKSAARELGISERTLYRKMNEYDIR